MAGLLYKDFIALKGKIYIVGGMILFGITMFLRFFVSIEGMDMLLLFFTFTVTMLLFLFLLMKLEISLIAVDDGKKQRQYFLSTPVTVRQYVASKYVFLLGAFYLILMLGFLMCSVSMIGCTDREVAELISSFASLLPVAACMMLFMVSLELPFFLGFGVKHGNRIKTGLILVIFLGGIIYLLFGDLAILDRLSLEGLLRYLTEHQELLLCIEVFLPYLALGMYYLSYRIACVLFERKEWQND